MAKLIKGLVDSVKKLLGGILKKKAKPAAQKQSDKERNGMYIYGVLNSDEELFFGPHGVTACEEVYTISCQDISAVVSDSEMVDYTHMRKDR